MPNRTKDDLWERQPGESAQAYEAFAIYRDMGSNRSLRVVAEQLSKSDTLIKRWSREKKWGERCRAYDNHLDDVARQEALRKYKKMRTRHIGIALQLQEKALAELKNLPDGSMTPKDIIQFLDKATELERDNRMEEAGVTAGGKTAEEQEETTLSLADEIAAAYENRKRGEQTSWTGRTQNIAQSSTSENSTHRLRPRPLCRNCGTLSSASGCCGCVRRC